MVKIEARLKDMQLTRAGGTALEQKNKDISERIVGRPEMSRLQKTDPSWKERPGRGCRGGVL
jgi:hypothetical protein